MFPASSPAVPLVTASVVACSMTWMVPPSVFRELPAVAFTTAKTRTPAVTTSAGTTSRFILSPPWSGPARPLSGQNEAVTIIERDGHERQADRQGLQDRPGSPLVSGLRRLRDPGRAPVLHAGAG